METVISNSPIFTPAQKLLLNAVSHLRTEDEILELKQAVSHFFFERATKEMDKLWDAGEWNEQTLKDLRNSHYRTPYMSQQ